MRLSSVKNSIKKWITRKDDQQKPFKTPDEQIEAESQGWYDKHWALQRVIHSKKLNEIGRLNGLLVTAGVREFDEKKPEEFCICDEVFAMLEYLIFNAPKVMASLLTMRTNSLKGQLTEAQAKAEKVLRATG